MTKNSWFVYIVESSDGYLYTGITTDVERRFKEHRGLAGKNKGAKFFRGRTAIAVRYTEVFADRSEASKRESTIKKMSAICKRNLFE